MRGLLYRGVLLFLIFLVFVLGVFFVEKRKKAKELEKIAFFDILSTLGNRYNFNNACEEFESKSGVCIVVDLDNFKNANDTFGHSVGDEIIKECGLLLKNIFGEKNTFRISGDEYYIFISSENFDSQLNELKNTLERSYTLKKYSISMSVGYFFKTFETGILEGFKKADTGMYRAKKISGNSFYCEG
ncbi:GGDEF domain-containing protein [Cetobacterium sp.]|uniref:GGDEF domain-containing protein n=1 Tax=Cetobacterium sp. TaxID=2071632 RepID=UPI003F3A279D